MVSGPSGVGSTPMVNFRPDPGEPAVRTSAREPQTAGLVTSQEQRNETRLRQRALARGDDVLFTSRTFTLGIGQTSPVIRAGLTSVVTQSDPNGAAPNLRTAPAAAGENQPNAPSEATAPPGQSEDSQESQEDNPLEPESLLSAEPNPNEKSEEELEEEERQLKNEDVRLERSLTQARLRQEIALEQGNPAQLEQAQREENLLKQEQEKLEREKQKVELEQLEKQLEETLQLTEEAINGNLEAAVGPLQVLFGLQSGGEEDQESANPLNRDQTPRPFDNTFFARKR